MIQRIEDKPGKVWLVRVAAALNRDVPRLQDELAAAREATRGLAGLLAMLCRRYGSTAPPVLETIQAAGWREGGRAMTWRGCASNRSGTWTQKRFQFERGLTGSMWPKRRSCAIYMKPPYFLRPSFWKASSVGPDGR